MYGFIKLNRAPETFEILKYPKAFALLSWIALRARWSSARNPYKLGTGQALIGDHREMGMTRGEYRHAAKVLEDFELATFKGTNKGTIATLINTDVFDINATPETNKAPNEQPPQNHLSSQTTTTNEEGEEPKEGKEKGYLNLDTSKW